MSNGVTEQCTNISIIEDSLVEEMEYFFVGLVSNDPRVIVTTANASVFIRDSSSKKYIQPTIRSITIILYSVVRWEYMAAAACHL